MPVAPSLGQFIFPENVIAADTAEGQIMIGSSVHHAEALTGVPQVDFTVLGRWYTPIVDKSLGANAAVADE